MKNIFDQFKTNYFDIDEDNDDNFASISNYNLSVEKKRDREEDLYIHQTNIGKKEDLFHSWFRNLPNHTSQIHSNNELLEAEFLWESEIDKKEINNKISEILMKNYENCDRTLIELMDISKKETKNEKRVSFDVQKSILLQEYETWRLLYLLYSNNCCFTSIKDTNQIENKEKGTKFSRKYSLYANYNNFVNNNSEYKKAFLILNWLESIEEYKTKNDPKKNFLFNKPELHWGETFKSINKNSNIVKTIDFDAPNRETEAQLSRSDQKDEEKLLLSIYRLLRAGQLDEAIELCTLSMQNWRAATLRGGFLYNDPNVEQKKGEEDFSERTFKMAPHTKYETPSGNQVENINMWRETCEMIADSSSNTYEKAIYYILCRNSIGYSQCNVQNKNIDGSLTWQDIVWANYKCSPMLDPLNICDISLNLKAFNNTIHLPCPSDSSSENISSQIELSFPKIQYLLMIWEIPSLLSYLTKFVQSVKDVQSLEIRPLRKFIANLVILLSKIVNDKVLDKKLIVSSYVEQLIKTNQIPLVPLYCSQLDKDLAIDLFAKFLTENFEKSRNQDEKTTHNKNITKQKLMEYAKIIELDPYSISQKLVDASPLKKQNVGLFANTHSPVIDFSYFNKERTSQNDNQIQAAEWIWIEAEKSEEDQVKAFSQTNTVARSFMLNDPPSYLELSRLVEKIPPLIKEVITVKANKINKNNEQIPEELSLEMETFLYLQISKCFNLYANWIEKRSLFENSNLESLNYGDLENSFDSLINYLEYNLSDLGERNSQLSLIQTKMIPTILYSYDNLYRWFANEYQKDVERKHLSCKFFRKHLEISGVAVSRGWILRCLDPEKHIKPIFNHMRHSAMQILKNGHSDPLDFVCNPEY